VASVDVAGAGGVVGSRVETVTAVTGLPTPLQAGIDYGTVAVVSTLAGNGAYGYANGVGTAARFNYPCGVSLDGEGGLYVADTDNHVIRRVDIVTRNVITVAGTHESGNEVGATPLQSKFNGPVGIGK